MRSQGRPEKQRDPSRSRSRPPAARSTRSDRPLGKRPPRTVSGVLVNDATARKIAGLERDKARLERSLQSTARFLKDILETSSTISIVSSDLDHTIRYWNTGAEKLFGYTAAEVVGKATTDLLYVLDDEATKRAIGEARACVLTSKKGTTCDVLERTKDGKELWMKLTMVPRLDEQGDIVGILGIGLDITEHKQLERKLQHSLRRLRRAVGGTIHAVALTVEKRDPYTAGHQRRATDLARAIAVEMALPKDQIDGIRMAGVIHDLGKMHVPAEILNKPGSLTKNEFTLIKGHPESGYDIIKYIEFPWPIGQIVLQHHERINGSGYPQGLRGEQICLEARIMAVADVVESMSSHRPYRPALGVDKALQEITTNRGVLYDPVVVDACLRLFKQKGFELQGKDALGSQLEMAERRD